VTRIGAAKPITVDVRVIAATNKALEMEIAAGRFREDLFYRLNVVPIAVPPLRARRSDIPALVERFVAELRAQGIAPKRFTPDAIAALQRGEWPGNVRELRNTVERLLILAPGPDVTGAEVEPQAASGNAALDFTSATFEAFKEEAERAFLVSKLEEHAWNVSETARRLEMPRSNLYKKIEKYGLERKE
jgi:two-component system nitrogen regulation response regulator NtrX